MSYSYCEPTISVIIPVHNEIDNFRKCLQSLADSDPIYKEIIIVADKVSDDSLHLIKEFDIKIKILRMTTLGGPAKARNLGARLSKGNILFFLDADITIRHDTVNQIIAAFQKNPDIDALFGSYDDEPSELNFLSQFKNLFHHYVHQTSNEDSYSFWSGCGAIRRDVFWEIGGFNEHYNRPSIEDIELGYRLKNGGYKTRLMKDLQVKHLKHWNLYILLKTDFFDRALPWTNLIFRYCQFMNDLNLKISDRFSIVFVYMLLLTLLAAFFIPWFFLLGVLCMGGLLALNWNLYRFFKNKRGLFFVIKVILWHWFYLFYCGLAFSIGFINYYLKKAHFKRETKP
ncbi:glycosyltransferase [Candidatus Latescibacterota bacterium]